MLVVEGSGKLGDRSPAVPSPHSFHPMKTLLFISPALLGIAFFAGCASGPTVQTEAVSTERSLASLEEFSIELDPGTARDVAFGPKQQAATREIISSELENLGYELTDNDDADFKVIFSTYTDTQVKNAQVVTTETRSVVTTDHAESIPEHRVVTTQQDEPILLGEASRLYLIDIVDAESNVLLWRGYTRREDTTLTMAAIENEIEDILDAFPFADNELSIRLDEFDFLGGTY